MDEEKITIRAKRKRTLAKLAPTLGELGFSRVEFRNDRLVVEKSQGEDLAGKKQLHYKIAFKEKEIEFTYSIPPGLSRRARVLEIFPVLLNAVRLAEEYYDISPSSMFNPISELLGEMEQVTSRDAIEMSAELDATRERLASMTKRYEDLVKSSEANARILIECEHRRDELGRRIKTLDTMGDESLKETLFAWLKVHGGSIDMSEFSKAHNGLSYKRIEEGLNMLIHEGYLKKKVI